MVAPGVAVVMDNVQKMEAFGLVGVMKDGAATIVAFPKRPIVVMKLITMQVRYVLNSLLYKLQQSSIVLIN